MHDQVPPPIRLPDEPRFLLLGCYGDGNAGDEALLEACAALLRDRWPRASLVAFSGLPSTTCQRIQIQAINNVRWFGIRPLISLARRGELISAIGAVMNCDCIVVGGGELLRTDYGLGSLMSVFDRITLARILGKPIIFLAVGASNLQPGLGLSIIKYVCAKAALTIRDNASIDALRSVGIHHAVRVPDLGFLLVRSAARVDLPSGPRVSISLIDVTNVKRRQMPIAREKLVSTCALLADTVVELGATPIFLPFCYGSYDDDRVFHREVVDNMRCPQTATVLELPLTPGEIKGIISSVDVVIGMRFHACVFGLSEGRRVMALAYEQKVTRVMRECGRDSVLQLSELDRGADLLRRLWREDRPATTPIIRREALAAFGKCFDAVTSHRRN